MTIPRVHAPFNDLDLLRAANLALVEAEPGVWNVVKNRTGALEHRIDWLRRQVLIDQNVTRSIVANGEERLLEKRCSMPPDDLSGDRVATNEHEARTSYPGVCWAHPQLYPGVMVPNWAVALRDACIRVGLSGFGRDLLQHAKKLFPPRRRTAPVNERHAAARDKADNAKEAAGLQAVKAAIAVLDSWAGVTAQQGGLSGAQQDAKEALAMQVVDVLEAGGMRFNTHGRSGPFRSRVPREERERINEQSAREFARAELLAATRATTPRRR